MTFTTAQLHQVLDNHLQEGLYLEFKRGAALGTSSAARQELVKDCTGFANAGGGTILYGIAEEEVEGVPAGAALSPVVAESMNGDWLTNVIRSNTSPPLSCFEITELAVPGGRVIAIEIDASSTAHQNLLDRRYYQRAGRSTEPMVDFQIRDVMSRRLRPEVRVDSRLVNIESNGDLHRKELEVLITNVGQVTLDKWRFEMDLPHEVIRDTRDADVMSLLDALVESWSDTMSLAQGLDNQCVLRITCGDPDEEQRRRLIHPGQTHMLVNPNKHPAIVVEVDHAIWNQIHGRSIFWRIFLPNSQPIKGEWRFEEWCNF
jgi:Putative DNA-binding domain